MLQLKFGSFRKSLLSSLLGKGPGYSGLSRPLASARTRAASFFVAALPAARAQRTKASCVLLFSLRLGASIASPHTHHHKTSRGTSDRSGRLFLSLRSKPLKRGNNSKRPSAPEARGSTYNWPRREMQESVGGHSTGACIGSHYLSLPCESRLRLRRERYSLIRQSSHSALHLSWKKYLPSSATDLRR